MKILKVHDCTEEYINTNQIKCAEIFHDTFHYNVFEATRLARTIAKGNPITIDMPLDSDHDRVLNSLKKLGLNCSLIEHHISQDAQEAE